MYEQRPHEETRSRRRRRRRYGNNWRKAQAIFENALNNNIYARTILVVYTVKNACGANKTRRFNDRTHETVTTAIKRKRAWEYKYINVGRNITLRALRAHDTRVKSLHTVRYRRR